MEVDGRVGVGRGACHLTKETKIKRKVRIKIPVLYTSSYYSIQFRELSYKSTVTLRFKFFRISMHDEMNGLCLLALRRAM